MATRYVCDHCGLPAITRERSATQIAFASSIGIPIISRMGTKIEIIILKDSDDGKKESEMCYDERRDHRYGDICRRCLLAAIEEGIERSDG